jgi:hypothetical protein
MSTGLLPKWRRSPSGGRRRWRCRPRQTGSARARTGRGTRPGAPARWPARSVPGPRCTRSRAATCPAPRARRAGRRPRRSRRRGPVPAWRWTAAGADVVDRRIGLSSPICQQRSMTSCARRWISGLPRCTEAKSRSAVLVPVAIDGGRAAAQADQHAGAAELDQQRAGRKVDLEDVAARCCRARRRS